MGVDQNIHIGPYLKCLDAGIPKTKKIRLCSANPSDRIGAPGERNNFCPTCGSEIVEQLQTFPGEVVRSVSPWDIAGAFDERITPVQGMCEFGKELESYWTSNKIDDGVWSVSIDMYDQVIQELKPETLTEGRAKFAEVFASEIEILKSHYASVEICWGILSWCS